jgi:hypothetical protein
MADAKATTVYVQQEQSAPAAGRTKRPRRGRRPRPLQGRSPASAGTRLIEGTERVLAEGPPKKGKG